MEVEGLGVCRVVVQRDAADACPSAMPPFCGRHRSNFGINCIFFNIFTRRSTSSYLFRFEPSVGRCSVSSFAVIYL